MNEQSKKDLKARLESKVISEAEVLLELAADVKEYFVTEQNEVYVVIEEDGQLLQIKIKNSLFKSWLRKQMGEITKKPITSHTLEEAVQTIIAQQLFNLNNRAEVNVRVAGNTDNVYIDLGLKTGEVVKINRNGWEIVNDVEVKFTQYDTTRSLPYPTTDTSILDLRKHVNLSDQQFTLVIGFILGSIKPKGPYPILVLQGGQGSAKSTLTRIIKALIDPVFASVRSVPKNEEDLVISAQKNWLLAFDNLSGISHKMSDALCKISTGGGFSTRKFHTNDEEVVLSAVRPVVLNGIDYIATYPDLADRSIIIHLPPIHEDERKSEEEIWSEFEKDYPSILGSIYDLISKILDNYQDVKLDKAPRMADFARWVTAAGKGFAGTEVDFLVAYQNNIKEAKFEAVEYNLLATAIVSALQRYEVIEGNATELLDLLSNYIAPSSLYSNEWVKNPNQLKNKINRILPILEANGIYYSYDRSSVVRNHKLFKKGEKN